MKKGWLYIVALGLCSSAATGAPAIYKCTKPDGSTVFSPTPCGPNAKEVDTSGALKAGTSPNVQGVSDRAALSSIDGECRNRDLQINDDANAELRRIEVEVRALRNQMVISANNYAGATRDSGIRDQISAAEGRRADTIRERDRNLRELAKSCDERRAAEQKRQADRDAAKQ